jgi:hypothetical protein
MDPDFLETKRRYMQQILNAMSDRPQQFMKPVPADSYGPLREGECWSPIPSHPADADVDAI